MVCSNCGYALAPDDQYCGGCGAFLSDAPEEGAAAAEPGYDDSEPSRSGPSAPVIAVIVAAVALVGVLLFWFLRGGGEEAVATDTVTTPVQTTTDQATDAATDEVTDEVTDEATDTSTATDTPTETPTDEPERTQIERPASARACNNVGDVVVYRGNDTTSCPFAENVARAYAELDQPVSSEVSLNGVTSPVTGEDYDLTCEYTSPVRCTGGNNAVVYIAAS
jgi:cytoskeletal protein RodZ